jgi:hypothetical protein
METEAERERERERHRESHRDSSLMLEPRFVSCFVSSCSRVERPGDGVGENPSKKTVIGGSVDLSVSAHTHVQNYKRKDNIAFLHSAMARGKQGPTHLLFAIANVHKSVAKNDVHKSVMLAIVNLKKSKVHFMVFCD